MSESVSQSIKSDRISESTVARIAGNIAGELIRRSERSFTHDYIAEQAVAIARRIAAQVEKTNPSRPVHDGNKLV